MRRAETLLWIDCTAGAAVGVIVLAFSGWLSALEGLPQSVLLFTGAANLVYAAYSFSLARRGRRPLSLIRLLACANMAWAPVCVALAAVYWESATVFGLLHLIGEGLFVGALGAVEWSQQDRLVSAG